MTARIVTRIAALLGFIAIILGALGAHGPVANHLAAMQKGGVWHTALFYHLIHAVVLLFLSQRPSPPKWATTFFIIGVILFSGSLYTLAITDVKWIGMITPLGGISLLVGWACLFKD